MALSLQEISDRLEIQDLLAAYSHAIDTRNWDALDDVFTPDAHIDYSAMGGSKGNLAETKEFLRKAMQQFASFQHMVATSQIRIRGDVAEGRTICHNPMVLDRGNGQTHAFFCGLWYRDRFVRTEQGWRIQERVEEKSYFHNVPPDFQVKT
jgi:3-phenylpropionate/cinnamic acid dioxygenase small subunit